MWHTSASRIVNMNEDGGIEGMGVNGECMLSSILNVQPDAGILARLEALLRHRQCDSDTFRIFADLWYLLVEIRARRQNERK